MRAGAGTALLLQQLRDVCRKLLFFRRFDKIFPNKLCSRGTPPIFSEIYLATLSKSIDNNNSPTSLAKSIEKS